MRQPQNILSGMHQRTELTCIYIRSMATWRSDGNSIVQFMLNMEKVYPDIKTVV